MNDVPVDGTELVTLASYIPIASESGDAADYEEGDPCEVPEMADRRWYLVAVAGTSLALISLICNILITKVLLRPKHSHFFFLALLALSDSFLSFCYGPVIAMDIIRYRVRSLALNQLYLSYVGPLLALCNVSMTFSTLMIILATIERFLIINKSKVLPWFRKQRVFLASMMLLLAMLLKGTMFFEVEIIRNHNCTGLVEYEPHLTPLNEKWLYGTVFRFYVRNITTVFIPFFLLAYLNLRIVKTLRQQKRCASMFRFVGRSDHKKRIRSATRLLVLVVSSYLLANVINVLITAWEYLDFKSTQTPEAFVIYETLTDITSMLYVLSCATRLPIYLTCNREIRSAFKSIICSPLLGCCRHLHCHHRGGKVMERVIEENIPRKHSHGLVGYGTDFDRIVVAMALAAGVCRAPSECAASHRNSKQSGEGEERERLLSGIPLNVLNHITLSPNGATTPRYIDSLSNCSVSGDSGMDAVESPGHVGTAWMTKKRSGNSTAMGIIENPLAMLAEWTNATGYQ